LQRIIEAAPFAITLLDARTLAVVQANRAAARHAGRPPEQLVGQVPEALFDAVLAAERRREMEEALRAGGLTRVEHRIEAEGRTRIWDARYLPLAAPGQPADQLLLVAADVTALRAAPRAEGASPVDEVMGQVHAIAQAYGLQLGATVAP
jgi:PAS domain S-box-containing protein